MAILSTMSETRRLLQTLKQALREQGVTYAEVAAHLGLSEPSIKRLFSAGGLSLERLEQICGLLNLELADLVTRMGKARHRIDRLSLDQERELAADTQLLLVGVCVRDGMGLAEILETYALTEPQVIHLLARLDRLKLIELLPGNRVRLLISRDFHWLPNGPIEQLFRQRVLADFLRGDFKADDCRNRYLYGRLSSASKARLLGRIDAVLQEFSDRHNADLQQPARQRDMTGLLIAMRPFDALLLDP